ncbi:MAG: mechanosensitive ion channel family protein [Opitutus sp.]|nr:mechanosensitive ion channel family protein [Opitutus sp.]
MNNQLAALDQARSTLIDLGIKFGPKVFVAILILTVGFFAGRTLGRILESWLLKLHLEPPVRLLIVRVVRLIVLGLFSVMALQNLGVDLLPLIAGLSVAGAGVALAMQGVLGNLFAGLTIIFTKPFRVGEYVAMLGVEGRVDAIDLFSTKLSHADCSIIVVPNRKIVGEILHNYGRIRQLDLTVGVAYATDLNRALAAVNEVLHASPLVLKEPVAVVGVGALADSSINIAVKPWVDVSNYASACAAINKGIVEKFRETKIEIPFPQREIRVLGGSAA